MNADQAATDQAATDQTATLSGSGRGNLVRFSAGAVALGIAIYLFGLVVAALHDDHNLATLERLQVRGVACVLALVFMVIGLTRNRPRSAGPWWWLAAVIVSFLGRPILVSVSNVTLAGGWLNFAVITGTSVASVMSLLAIIRSRGTGKVTDSRLEMAVLILAYSAFVIPLGTVPGWNATYLVPYKLALGIIAPLSYILVVALVGRLLLVDLMRGRAAALLMTGWVVQILGDAASIVAPGGDPVIEAALDLSGLAAMLWAAAALHPSMVSVTEPATVVRGEWSRSRTTTIAVTATLPLVVGLVDPELTRPERVIVFMLGFLAIAISVLRTSRAVSALARAEHDSSHKARFDELTGLLNRRGLVELADATAGAMGVAYLDVDRFKLLNDVKGHRFGDTMLARIGDRLAKLPQPVVASARLGGDEFAILFDAGDSQRANTDRSMEVGRLIDDVFDAPVEIDHHPVQVTASTGIAVSADGDEQFLDLVARADIAQYYAKATGGGHVRDFTGEMGDERSRHQQTLEVLQRVGSTDEMWLAFQSIVDMDTGRSIGSEVLARMHTSDLGDVSPQEFINVAEQHGLIEAVGDWAFAQVVSTIDQVGSHLPDGFRIAVNISPLQIESEALVQRLLTLAAHRPEVLDRLRLEITESVFVRESSRRRLSELRRAGYQIAIDDFGSEYASLYYLADLDVDVLKIDQSFTRRVVTDPATRLIVSHVIELADQLGISVVTEGIETEAQRDLLVELGCHIGQGYLWERPAAGLDRFLVHDEVDLRRPGPRGGQPGEHPLTRNTLHP
ncbi:MAG: putative bifunctional diguanylate cyclase/phosphodiesterase [Microthrixaceae bacterium]